MSEKLFMLLIWLFPGILILGARLFPDPNLWFAVDLFAGLVYLFMLPFAAILIIRIICTVAYWWLDDFLSSVCRK